MPARPTPVLTPRITREANIGQAAGASSTTGKVAVPRAATALDAGGEIAPLLRRRVVARNAEHAHAIAAIRRGIHLQRHVVEVERRAQILTQRQCSAAAP